MQQHRKLFTLSEALSLLPTVRQLMIELQEGKEQLSRRSEEFEALLARTGGNGHLKEDIAVVRRETEQRAIELQKLFGELDGLGVELKGIDEGLVDFPSMREGRVVYLCWQLGEETISYWHDTDAGFRGRQPL